MESQSFADQICKKILNVFTSPISKAPAMSLLIEEISNVAKQDGRVFLFGVGREGLMMKAFCMRLYHIGLKAHCVHDMNTPSSNQTDLLIASSGPGGHKSVSVICEKAQISGARVLLLTAQPTSSWICPFASVIAHLPAQTMADDQDLQEASSLLLPMGSVYEGALFVLFEMVIYKLAKILDQNPEQIRLRHTNLE